MSDAIFFGAMALSVLLTGLACLLYGFDELLEEWFERGVRISDDCVYPPFRCVLWGYRKIVDQRDQPLWTRFVILHLPFYDWREDFRCLQWSWHIRFVKWTAHPHRVWNWRCSDWMYVRWVTGWERCSWDKRPAHR